MALQTYNEKFLSRETTNLSFYIMVNCPTMLSPFSASIYELVDTFTSSTEKNHSYFEKKHRTRQNYVGACVRLVTIQTVVAEGEGNYSI